MAMRGWEDFTMADANRRAARLETKPKRGKYGSTKTVIDGIAFDSKKEALCYVDLTLRQKAGQIKDLECQPKFEIYIMRADGETIHCADYYADFRYWEAGQRIVVDVKSKATRTKETYRLKKKLVEAIYGITIEER